MKKMFKTNLYGYYVILYGMATLTACAPVPLQAALPLTRSGSAPAPDYEGAVTGARSRSAAPAP